MAIFLIALLSLLSFYSAVKAILKGEYKPNIYSRIIWFLLAFNGLIGLIRLGSGRTVIALSIMQTLGTSIILIGALKFSIFKFGFVEAVASVLLLISLGVWAVGDYPAINVGISLIAHFIGGIPTIISVYKRPHTENVMFWGYFAIASFIALLFASKASIRGYMFPLYFMLFNITVFVLSVRQHTLKHKPKNTDEYF